MSETPLSNERFKNLPSEEVLTSVMKAICGNYGHVETNRAELGGKIILLQMQLTERNEQGLLVQLAYQVNPFEVASIDATYFDPAIGFNYRAGQGYEPENIVDGHVLGKFVAGIWIPDEKLSLL